MFGSVCHGLVSGCSTTVPVDAASLVSFYTTPVEQLKHFSAGQARQVENHCPPPSPTHREGRGLGLGGVDGCLNAVTHFVRGEETEPCCQWTPADRAS